MRKLLQMLVLICFVLSFHTFAVDTKVPGVVVYHSPASSGLYIGSPSITILPNGDYIATCDEFGPKSSEWSSGKVHVFRSSDNGESWSQCAFLGDIYWATVFVHKDKIYLIGTSKCYGDVVIRCSEDNGKTWTNATDSAKGRLKSDAQYHCAPVPVIVHNGYIWRAIERMGVTNQWGSFQAGVMSVSIDSDLLNAENWRFTNFLSVPKGHSTRHWLEGNVVVSPQGDVVNILRSGNVDPIEKAVLLKVNSDGSEISIDLDDDFIDLPGGSGKKFTISYDDKSKRYWALTNPMLMKHVNKEPGNVRNTLAISSSVDLRDWQIHKILLYHPDTVKHAFQYPDWVFDGDDIIFLSRTAFEDGMGGVHRGHDANFLTFHRINDFRELQGVKEDLKAF